MLCLLLSQESGECNDVCIDLLRAHSSSFLSVSVHDVGILEDVRKLFLLGRRDTNADFFKFTGPSKVTTSVVRRLNSSSQNDIRSGVSGLLSMGRDRSHDC